MMKTKLLQTKAKMINETNLMNKKETKRIEIIKQPILRCNKEGSNCNHKQKMKHQRENVEPNINMK